MKNALICGVGGQDGSYLARLLLAKGYRVWGTSRDAQVSNFSNLHQLGIADQVRCLSMAPTDFRSVLECLKRSEPDEVYFLSGQSSVGLSFHQPDETIKSFSLGVLNLLEAVRFVEAPIRIYHAGSSECFGDVGTTRATESMPFYPRSPYGVAKASAHWLVTNYREAYGLFATNGILFNHESPLRPARFVTKKIVSTIARIRRGSDEKLALGNLDVSRDWGWAPEYVDAMWRMLQADTPGDFVIATGRTASLRDFVATAFRIADLDPLEHLVEDKGLMRPADIAYSAGDPGKAAAELGWKAETQFEDVVRKLVEAELRSIADA